MKIISSLLLFSIIAVSACKQAGKPPEQALIKTDSVKIMTARVADATNTALVFNAYINLKDQFLKSNLAGIKSAAKLLENKLTAIKGCSETATLARQITTSADIKQQ